MVSLEFSMNPVEPYQLGDTLVFHQFGSEVEWLLVESNEKMYKFVMLWEVTQLWNSQKSAPVHRRGPLRHYRGGVRIR
jgi:hypothetical protein